MVLELVSKHKTKKKKKIIPMVPRSRGPRYSNTHPPWLFLFPDPYFDFVQAKDSIHSGHEAQKEPTTVEMDSPLAPASAPVLPLHSRSQFEVEGKAVLCLSQRKTDPGYPDADAGPRFHSQESMLLLLMRRGIWGANRRTATSRER